MKRERSYHDLLPEERKRYDRLRAIRRRLDDRGGARTKRCGSRSTRRDKIRAAADAMLGLRAEESTWDTAVERDPSYRVWRGSTTHARSRS